jgi:hypothetical protein
VIVPTFSCVGTYILFSTGPGLVYSVSEPPALIADFYSIKDLIP